MEAFGGLGLVCHGCQIAAALCLGLDDQRLDDLRPDQGGVFLGGAEHGVSIVGFVLVLGGLCVELPGDLCSPLGPQLRLLCLTIGSGECRTRTRYPWGHHRANERSRDGYGDLLVDSVSDTQGLALGCAGGVMAAVAVGAGGIVLREPEVTLVAGPLLALAVALLTAGVSLAVTMLLAYRLTPAVPLRPA